MGRKQTVVSHFADGPQEGPGWARPYRIEWGKVVGQRVRRLRQARRLALHELAAMVPKPEGGDGRYSAGYFSRLERGWTSPPLYVYIGIAEALCVRPGELLGPEDVDREVTPQQRMLLDVVERLGLALDDVVAGLVADARAGLVPDGRAALGSRVKDGRR